MADIPNILPYVGKLDIVTPIEAAMRMHESRENEKTQRMFAQNTMARQSAADFRDQRDYEDRKAERERQHGIDTANAVAQAQQMMRSPGGLGPAQALIDAYGGHLNPLTAAAVGAPPPPAGDAVDQVLAQNGGGGGGPPPAGAPGAPLAPAPVVGPSGAGAPPSMVPAGPEMSIPGAPMEGPVEPGAAPLGNAPPTPLEGPQQMRPAPSDADLERLMAAATPARPAPPPPPEPTNPLYEAVLGAHHYPMSTEQPTTGLGPKYENVFRQYIAQGAKPAEAFKAVLAEKEKDDGQGATEARLLAGIGARGEQTDKRDAEFRLTTDQRLQMEKDREANARSVARIRAAAAGASTPQQQTALAHMIAMKEDGAADSEIAAFGAQNHVDPKVWNAPVKNVSTEANQNTRTTERRASMEVTDENGKSLGPAKSAQEAATLSKQTKAWSQIENRYEALIKDVEQNGERINPANINAVQRRTSLFNLAQGAGRVYNGFGGTDASQVLEHGTMGGAGVTGNGLIMGANAGVLRHLLDEARAQHQARLNVGLRSGGGQPLPAAVTHANHGAANGAPDLDELEKWSASLGGR